MYSSVYIHWNFTDLYYLCICVTTLHIQTHCCVCIESISILCANHNALSMCRMCSTTWLVFSCSSLSTKQTFQGTLNKDICALAASLSTFSYLPSPWSGLNYIIAIFVWQNYWTWNIAVHEKLIVFWRCTLYDCYSKTAEENCASHQFLAEEYNSRDLAFSTTIYCNFSASYQVLEFIW